MIHQNSTESLIQTRPTIAQRRSVIREALEHLRIATDREIKNWLGFDEMNAVRPRITEMIKDGALVECESVKCQTMGRKVRRVKLAGES